MTEKKQSPNAVLLGLAVDSKGKFVESVIFAIIGVVAGVVPYFMGAKIIVALMEGNTQINYFGKLCTAALLAYILKVVFANVSTTVSHSATYKTLKSIRLKMISKLSKMPMGTLLDTPSGQMKDTIVDRVEGLETTLAHLIPEMTANILIPLCLLVYLFVLDWRMALLTLAVFPFGMCFVGVMGKTYPAKYQESVRINKHMNDTVVEYVNGIEVIKAFNQSSNSYKKYEEAVVDNASFFYNWMKSCQWPMSAYTAICPSTLLTVLPVGCIFYINGTLTAETFVTIMIISMSIIGPILAASNKVDRAIEESFKKNEKLEKAMTPYVAMQQLVLYVFGVILMFCAIIFYLNGSMELTKSLIMVVCSFLVYEQLKVAGNCVANMRIAEHSIDKANKIDDVPTMDEGGKNIVPATTEIKFENVDFAYEKKKILDNVSVTIPEKKMTAIVGPSGSGKTTLCSMIPRFWDVDAGSVSIGGVNVKDYTLNSLMKNVSMVFQNVYLFADTIENNIKFGKADATHEEVVEAAKRACCHEFIMALPEGYNTMIGEGGASLSGGEKQRISIARALIKDAEIVIFDEATANVDPENEDRLQNAMEELTKNKTVIMIAHRLKTVRNAEKILVLSDGKIVQEGRHEELIKEAGIYADFVNGRKEAIGWKLGRQ